MSFDKLLSDLAAAKGRDLPQVISVAIEDMFSEMGYSLAKRIVDDITTTDHCPSNIVGAIRRRWIDEKARRAEELSRKQKWEAESKEACSTEEWQTFWEICHMILTLHQQKRVAYNHDGVTTGLSIDEWVDVGRPLSWSPALDHFLQGYERAYKLDMQKPGAVVDYLKKYKDLLHQKFFLHNS
jgi:hypothetical protein